MLGPEMASRGQWSFATVFGGLLTPSGLQHNGPLAAPWRFGGRRPEPEQSVDGP